MSKRWLALAICVVILAYLPAMRAPFEFDDAASIPGNASIQTLWPPSVPLNPPANTSVLDAWREILPAVLRQVLREAEHARHAAPAVGREEVAQHQQPPVHPPSATRA